MTLVRIVKTAQVTLTHTFQVDEVPTDAAGNVAVELKRLDGTSVNTANAVHAGTGQYRYAVPGQANLDLLTCDMTGTVAGAQVTVRDYVEIVGGHYFGLAAARAAHEGLASTTVYPTDGLAAARISVEQEFEDICRQAFYPRFARHKLAGRGTDRLSIPQHYPHRKLRTLRAITPVGGTAWDPADVAAVRISESGILTRPGGAVFGDLDYWLEYEHGWDYPPNRIIDVAVLRLRSLISANTTGVPDRAVSWYNADGGTFRLSTPGKQTTGVPEVDGVLERMTVQRRTVQA